MHCKACDTLMSEKEAGRKDPLTGDFADMCDECYAVSYETLMLAMEDHNSNQIRVQKGDTSEK